MASGVSSIDVSFKVDHLELAWSSTADQMKANFPKMFRGCWNFVCLRSTSSNHYCLPDFFLQSDSIISMFLKLVFFFFYFFGSISVFNLISFPTYFLQFLGGLPRFLPAGWTHFLWPSTFIHSFRCPYQIRLLISIVSICNITFNFSFFLKYPFQGPKRVDLFIFFIFNCLIDTFKQKCEYKNIIWL